MPRSTSACSGRPKLFPFASGLNGPYVAPLMKNFRSPSKKNFETARIFVMSSEVETSLNISKGKLAASPTDSPKLRPQLRQCAQSHPACGRWKRNRFQTGTARNKRRALNRRGKTLQTFSNRFALHPPDPQSARGQKTNKTSSRFCER